MNKLFENKYILMSVIVTIVLIFIGLVIYSFNRESFEKFRLVDTLPEANQNFPSSSTQLNINFNKEIDASKITLGDSNNNSIVSGISVDKKTLILKLYNLKINQRYTITIKEIVSNKGDVLKNTKINFKTKYIPFSDLTEAQQKLQIEDTDPKPATNIITNFLPYNTQNYDIVGGKITYSDGKTSTVVVVKDLFYPTLTPPYPESEIAYTAKSISDFLASTKVDRKSYVLTADNPTLAKLINSDSIPPGSKIKLDNLTGD